MATPSFQNLKGFRNQKLKPHLKGHARKSRQKPKPHLKGHARKSRQKPKPHLKGHARKSRQIWQRLKEKGSFSPHQQLPWGRVENVARERLYARGAHLSKVQSTPIAFFGCGALGSSVAELLARGGIKKLNLFDPDSINFGNLCRHTLDGSSVGLNKAVALAERLSRANPLSTIEGHAVGIPLDSRSDETIRHVLADADVFVDCTTSEAAFDWLNEYYVENGKRLISLFFNLHAELLTICISGESTSCREIFDDLRDSVKKKQTPLDPSVYFHEPSKEEEIIEGAGCWHPTFPVLNAHVQILAAHAVDVIIHFIESKQKIGLAAIIKRQTVTQNGVQPGPLVEVVWGKRILTNKFSMKWQSECKRYTVLISESCFLKIKEMAQAHYPNEVGTSLVGCYSDDGFEASVLELAPLTPDSKGSHTSFYRGIAGLRKFFAKLRRTFSGKRHYVGEWHSHPGAAPLPSKTDDQNQGAIATDTKTDCPECILIIIGCTLSNVDEIGVFVYSRKRGRVVLHFAHSIEQQTRSLFLHPDKGI